MGVFWRGGTIRHRRRQSRVQTIAECALIACKVRTWGQVSVPRERLRSACSRQELQRLFMRWPAWVLLCSSAGTE